ncbi:hypothetical protein KDL01_24400 [Actinospica durhamensis]|uniref:Uncharacterized protein n=1 Tax=Actinospica durhamensis TaxID=1508375 RepID=A0A941IV48_9ACTN|nr:LamG-like jellyroll fold domain-containing protein [Actinospica durhamensis]MBR7836441.1 hypothetical protein [Actinospica durhamensis]
MLSKSRERRIWSRQARRIVASLTFALMVVAIGTQSATAAQLTPGRLPLGGVERLVKDLFAPAPAPAPRQEYGHGVAPGGTKAHAGSGRAPGVGIGQQPAEAAETQRVHPARSGSIRRGFDPATSTFLAAKSSAKTSWWRNADGTETEKLSAAAVNYRTAAGTWAPIDTSLLENGAAGWQQKANSFGLMLAADSGQAANAPRYTPGARASTGSATNSPAELVALSFGAGEAFGWNLSGAADVTGSVTGSVATYRAILPETDLTLISENWGVKEELTLASAAAAHTWTFPLAVTGLRLGRTQAGRWQLTNTSGAVVAVLPAPFANDAAGARTQAVTYTLSTVAGVQRLTMTLDAAWLASSARKFPVTVDPTLSNPGTETSAYISAANPSWNSNTGTSTVAADPGHLGVGYTTSPSQDIQRAYINYPSGLEQTGYHITAASLTMFMTSGSTAGTDPFSVYSSAYPWSPTTLDAGNAPGSYISELGTYGGGVVNTGPCNGAGGNWIGTTLNAAALSQFAVGTYKWNGVFLIAGSESNTAYYRMFDSADVAACSPYLSLTYTPDVAPTLSTMSPASATAVSTLTPEFTASGTDADAWPDASVQYEFYVYSANGTPLAHSQLQSSGAWSVPAHTLRWSNTYQWGVCVWDGYECEDPGSQIPTNWFATTAPGPMLGQAMSQSTDGHGFDAESGDYTASATDADVAGVGPSLAVVRDYNSLNDSHTGAFGAGWSSLLDAQVTEGLSPSGALGTAEVTYPDGSLVVFGLNADGSYSPPQGRYATLTPITSSGTVVGYTLSDKDGTSYTFGHVITAGTLNQGSKSVPGRFGLTAVTDHEGVALQVTWQQVSLSRQIEDSGATITVTGTFTEVGTIANAVTGRLLSFNWVWPNIKSGEGIPADEGSSQPHVASVLTNDATANTPSTAQLWTYGYSADRLATVCAPSATASAQASSTCATYTYQDGSVYRQAVLDSGAYQFWPMSDTAGGNTVGTSLVAANIGAGVAAYQSLSPDSSTTSPVGPMTAIGSGETGAAFNGTDSYMTLPSGMVLNSTYISAGLWFKTTKSGPLLCEQNIAITGTSTQQACPLYIGTDGKLRAEWYIGSTNPITTSSAVNDGTWHFALLSGEGTSQTLYLDGAPVGTLSGTINNLAMQYEYVGAGYNGANWPATPSAQGNWFFTGSIADLAVYRDGVPATEVASLYSAATTPAQELTQVNRPDAQAAGTQTTEQPAAVIKYDTVTGRVKQVTDANGGTYLVSAPAVTGSGQVFREAVLADAPSSYYRLEDTSGSYPADEVNADAWTNPPIAAAYNNVGLGADPSPFNLQPDADGTTAAKFTASQGSYIQLPQNAGTTVPQSIGMWFLTSTAGPLYCMQNTGAGTTPGFADCPLYVGANGRLYGGWYMGSTGYVESAQPVDDGKWHYVVLSAAATSQSMYLDGSLVGSETGTFNNEGQANSFIGYGYASGAWPETTVRGGYWNFTGDVSDVALFPSALSQDQVSTLWQAYHNAVGSISPLETVTVTDPANTLTGSSGTETYAFDPLHDGRQVSYTDPEGDRTTYGYDINGFASTTVDANGDETITGRDARGNAVSTTTCQNQAANACQTSYAAFYWSAHSEPANTADVDADLVVTSSDARSSSPSDTTYRTTYGYDASGNATTVTPPASPSTTSVYTNATMTFPACVPGSPGTLSTTQHAPAGLLASTTKNTGAAPLPVTSYFYYPNGDSCETVNADGLETLYSYDGLGRVLAKTVTGSANVPAPLVQYGASLTTDYAYDGDGRVVQSVAPATTDRVTGVTHTAVTTDAYDADGNLLSSTVADSTGGDYSRTTTYTYNGDDQKVGETSPDGNPSSSTTAGVTTTIPADTTQNHTTTYTYDAFGNVETQTDPQGRATRYLYDANDRAAVTEELNTNPDGTVSTTGAWLTLDRRWYDPAGRLAEESDGDYNAASPAADANASYATCYLYYDDDETYAVIRIATDQSTICPGTASAAAADQAAGKAMITTLNWYDNAGDLTQTVSDDETVTDFTYDAAGRQITTTLDPATPSSPTAVVTTGLDRINTLAYGADGYVSESKTAGPGASGTVVEDETYTYSPMGEQLTQSVADGSSTLTTTTTRDERGLPTSQTSPNGASGDAAASTTYFIYDEAGRLVATQSPKITSTTFDVATMSPTEVSAYAITTTGYDTFGDEVEYEGADSPNAGLAGTKNATADSTVSSYDADGNRTSATEPEYTAPGATSATLAESVTKYDGADEPIETVDPVAYDSYLASGSTAFTAGLVSQVAYDQFGKASSSTSTDYTAGTTASASYTYDRAGRELAVTDPLGVQAQQTYDFLGRVATSTRIERDPTDGQSVGVAYTTDYTYGAGGWLSEVQSPDAVLGAHAGATAADGGGTTETYAYDVLGEKIAVTEGTGAAASTTGYTYDAAGRVVKTTKPDGSYTTSAYDEAGRQIGTAAYDKLGTEQTWTQDVYDDDGNLICAEGPLPGTSVAALPGPPSATGSAAVTPANYTSTCVANSSYAFTQYQYDPTGLLTAEIQPVNSTPADSVGDAYGYDAVGNETAFADGDSVDPGNGEGKIGDVGHTDYTTYNAWQLPETAVEPAASSNTYTSAADRETTKAYTADGQIATVTEPGGVTQTDGYDGYGDLTTESGTGAGAPTATRSFSYDLDGRVTSAATSNTLTASSSPSASSTATTGTAGPGTNATAETFGYDDRGDLTSVTGSAGTSDLAYNGDSLEVSASNGTGATTQTTGYTYDTADRLSTLADPTTGTTLTYGYNPASDTGTITYGTGGDVRTLHYNAVGEPTSDTLATSSGTTVAALTYGWDATGDLTGKTDSSGTANTYTYDQAARLTSWSTPTTSTAYSYDADSNRTCITTTSVATGKATSAETLTYDARDEVTGVTDSVNTSSSAYTYTAQGTVSQIATVSSTGATSTSSLASDAYGQQVSAGTAGYTYDALGRLLGETAGTTGSTTLQYSGTGNDVSYDGANSYSRDPNGDLIGTADAATGTSALLWTDAHTDVVGAFTASGGSLAGTETYNPLGEVLTDTGATTGVTLGYQSEYTDSATGHVNMAARWYNPSTGQFLAADTAANSAAPDTANANPFAYGDDNPLVNTDPTGHWSLGGFISDLFNFNVAKVEAGVTLHGLKEFGIGVGDGLQSWFEATEHPTPETHKNLISGIKHDLKAAGNSLMNFSQSKNPIDLGKGVIDLIDIVVPVKQTYKALKATYQDLKSGNLTKAGSDFFNLALGTAAVATAALPIVKIVLPPDMLATSALDTVDSSAVVDGPAPAADTVPVDDADPVAASALADTALENAAQSAGAGVGEGADAGSSAGATDANGDLPAPKDDGDPADPAPSSSLKNKFVNAVKNAVQCVTHSFTGETGVLMADGTSKPIDQLHVGDLVANSAAGKPGLQTHKVDAVIVTHTDHDYVAVTVKPVTKPGSVRAASKLTKTLAATAMAATAAMAPATAPPPAPRTRVRSHVRSRARNHHHHIHPPLLRRVPRRLHPGAEPQARRPPAKPRRPRPDHRHPALSRGRHHLRPDHRCPAHVLRRSRVHTGSRP